MIADPFTLSQPSCTFERSLAVLKVHLCVPSRAPRLNLQQLHDFRFKKVRHEPCKNTELTLRFVMELKNGFSMRCSLRVNLVSLSALALLLAGCGEESAPTEFEVPEDDVSAFDNNVTVPSAGHHHTQTASLVGGPRAHLDGEFAPSHDWPIIPIATMLLPDGRVLAYGTDGVGNQGALLSYVIWTPSMGTGLDAFKTWDNGVHQDIFCAGQALIPSTGDTLLVGGEEHINGEINYGNANVTVFDRSADTLVTDQSMVFKRWYATLVTLPDASHVVLGGRISKAFDGGAGIPPTVASYASTPEVRAANGTWSSLTTATDDAVYGSSFSAWNYPRAWVDPQGKVFIVNYEGKMYQLDTLGTGTLKPYTVAKTSGSSPLLSSVMFAPGRILSIRKKKQAVVININSTPEPTVTDAGVLAYDRQYGSATVLADGKVWVNGGSPNGNSLDGGVFESEMWNPATGEWKIMARASTIRLYHSTSMLMPDGTVFTGGGGAPGPLNNLNGEIFYPPYLFKKDGSGVLATQPTMTAPDALVWNQLFSITGSEKITKVTLIRIGGATHDYNNETRFYNLALTTGAAVTVTVRAPASAKVAPPGYYMIFTWNAAGVPSVGKIVKMI